MRLRLDPWAVDYQTAMQADLASAPRGPQEVDFSLEQPASQWRAVRPQLPPPRLAEAVFLDGSRRVEARLLLEDERSQVAYGALGACAVGAARCAMGEGRGRADFLDCWKLSRFLALSGGHGFEDLPLPAGGRWLGELRYAAASTAESDPDAVVRLLQQCMLQAERELAARLAQDRPEALIVCDGSRPLLGPQRQVLGYVKTVHELRLGPEQLAVVRLLEAGERSPLYLVRGRDPQHAYFEWFLRLRDPRPWLYTLAGTVRLQAFAGADPRSELDWARTLADWSCRTLPRLASLAHQDPRAPQQLLPVRALEAQLRRRLGDPQLARRRLVAALRQAEAA